MIQRHMDKVELKYVQIIWSHFLLTCQPGRQVWTPQLGSDNSS